MKKGKDALGERMKSFYENITRTYLPRRTYTIIRIDGKAFHTYTKGLKRPFDEDLIGDMDKTAIYLCKNIPGAKLAFVQSDEISIVVTDFDTLQTQAWYDGNIQKIVSISASMATSKFNQLRTLHLFGQVACEVSFPCLSLEDFEAMKLAEFDSRTFTIPFRGEVINYLIWRQQDTVRNSIQSAAQSMYPRKELDCKNQNDMQEMIFQKGVNWNDYDAKYKRGRLIYKQEISEENAEIVNTKNGEIKIRSKWVSVGAPTFTQDKELINKIIIADI